MANSNNICIRFINYAAVLILLFFSSLSFAYTGSGGQFGGGGADGSWGDSLPDSVKPTISCDSYRAAGGAASNQPTANQACQVAHGQSGWWGGTFGEYSSSRQGCFGNNYHVLSGLQCIGQKLSCPANYTLQGSLCILNTNACPVGYEKDANGKCQPKKCPVGQTLVNGQCKQKQCPAGQALDLNGNCMPRDDQCPAGQKMVNGRCITPPPDDPDDPDDPNSTLPPFCEWASVMCQWHQEWQQWSNDYAANEEKANLDREVIKDLIGESVLRLDDIKTKMDDHKITIDEIKNQDQQFYDELRLWLQNFDSTHGNPSEQNPSIQFPTFCDWSVQVCNWYLDWKDWRADYNAHNEVVIQKFNAHLEKLDEIKQQDNDFYDDARDFFDWYKGQSENTDPNDPENPENQDGNVAVNQEQIPLDESQRITFVNACPPDQQFTINFMGRSQTLGFSYQPLCQFMTMIRPFVIAIAYLIGAYILMGLSRGSSE